MLVSNSKDGGPIPSDPAKESCFGWIQRRLEELNLTLILGEELTGGSKSKGIHMQTVTVRDDHNDRTFDVRAFLVLESEGYAVTDDSGHLVLLRKREPELFPRGAYEVTNTWPKFVVGALLSHLGTVSIEQLEAEGYLKPLINEALEGAEVTATVVEPEQPNVMGYVAFPELIVTPLSNPEPEPEPATETKQSTASVDPEPKPTEETIATGELVSQ